MILMIFLSKRNQKYQSSTSSIFLQEYSRMSKKWIFLDWSLNFCLFLVMCWFNRVLFGNQYGKLGFWAHIIFGNIRWKMDSDLLAHVTYRKEGPRHQNAVRHKIHMRKGKWDTHAWHGKQRRLCCIKRMLVRSLGRTRMSVTEMGWMAWCYVVVWSGRHAAHEEKRLDMCFTKLIHIVQKTNSKMIYKNSWKFLQNK